MITVGGAATVGEAVPPLSVVEAVHGPTGWPILTAVSRSLPRAVPGPVGGAVWLLGGRGRARTPGTLPAAAPVVVGVGLGLQEVQESHGDLHIGALVAVDAVRPPAVVETVHQVAHAAVLLAREDVPRGQELGGLVVEPGCQLDVELLQVTE
jgi:hypothetical protein